MRLPNNWIPGITFSCKRAYRPFLQKICVCLPKINRHVLDFWKYAVNIPVVNAKPGFIEWNLPSTKEDGQIVNCSFRTLCRWTLFLEVPCTWGSLDLQCETKCQVYNGPNRGATQKLRSRLIVPPWDIHWTTLVWARGNGCCVGRTI